VKIYLLRHGESEDDANDSYGGIADFELTKEGMRQARDMADELADSGIEIIYSSPFRRAVDTANIVAKKVGCDVEVVEGLRDRNTYGVLTAIKKDDAQKLFGWFLDKMKSAPGDYDGKDEVPGSEPRAEFDIRVKLAFEEILDQAVRQKRECIALVTHSNLVKSIYRNVLKIKGNVEQELMAKTIIDYTPAIMKLEELKGVEIKK
jgi:broad specificity phosphatase PhoE